MNPVSESSATISDKIALPASERIQAVLASTFGGMHHVFSLKKFNEGSPREFWTIVHSGDLATFDFDYLTALVVFAHDYGVRVSIQNGGPRALKVLLHARYDREGHMYGRHPALETAVGAIRPRFRAN